MTILQYLTGYPETLRQQVNVLIERDQLGKFLLQRHPSPHAYTTDKSLYQYAILIKNEYIRNSPQLSKVCYDNKIHTIKHALGMHTSISRIQGNKLKAKNEIRISNVFKLAAEPLLKMIVVHELAHLKEKSHNKDFYQLCCYMEPEYHQLEFDARLYLTYLEKFGPLY